MYWKNRYTKPKPGDKIKIVNFDLIGNPNNLRNKIYILEKKSDIHNSTHGWLWHTKEQKCFYESEFEIVKK